MEGREIKQYTEREKWEYKLDSAVLSDRQVPKDYDRGKYGTALQEPIGNRSPEATA